MSFADRIPESVKQELARKQLDLVEPETEEIQEPLPIIEPERETFGSEALDAE